MGIFLLVAFAFLVGYVLPRPEWAEKVYNKILEKL